MSALKLPSVDGVKAVALLVAAGAGLYVLWKMYNAKESITTAIGGTADSISKGIVDIFGAKPGVVLTDQAKAQAAANADLLKSMDSDFKLKNTDFVGPPEPVFGQAANYGTSPQVDSPDASGLSDWEWNYANGA